MSPIEAANALLRQNPLWKQLFEQNPAIQLIIDPANRLVLDANPAACRFYRYKREQFRDMPLDNLEIESLPEEDSHDESTLFVFQHRTAKGEVRSVKINAHTYDLEGVTLLHLIIFDITKRRRAEVAEQGQRALAAALVNTAAALVNTLDLHEVLDRILEQVQHIIPNDYVNLMLIEDDYASVVRHRGYNRVTDVDQYVSIRLNIHSTPTLRWMTENRRPLIIPDIKTDSRWLPLYTTEGWIGSYMGAPIRMGNYVIGFLNLDSSTVGRFGDYDANSLQAFADQAGVAIRNARLFERVRRQAMLMEQRVAERTAELDYERKQLRAILDSMTEGVYYSEVGDDGSLRPRYLNRAMVRMLGYEPNRDPSELLHLLDSLEYEGLNPAAVERDVQRALQTQGFVSMQASLKTPSGIVFDASLTTTRVDGRMGELFGAVTVVRDISQEIALERQRSRFVAQASHELRTPITNLKTRLYLLHRQPERLPEHLPVLETVTTQMGRLVESLLDISRLERGTVKLRQQNIIVQDLIRLVAETHRPVIEQKGQTLSLELPAEPIHLIADPDRLTQVLNNLISNASTYTPHGGSITIRVSRTPLDATGSAIARFEVIDNGVGIPADQREDIFQPFYRIATDGDGAGLGLSITREIVELHGGAIRVDSTPDQGSCFSFWLPLKQTPQEASVARG